MSEGMIALVSNKGYFKDDIPGRCDRCNSLVAMRPHTFAMITQYKCKKECLSCAVEQYGEAGVAQMIDRAFKEGTVDPITMAEVKEYMQREVHG